MYITVKTVDVLWSIVKKQTVITEMPNSCGLFSEFHVGSKSF
jgi:hypothetical protein